MAIDTRNKRASAIRHRYPLPDGAITIADRRQRAGFYSGLASVAVVIAGPYCVKAAEVFVPGMANGEAYRPGSVASEVFTPGMVVGQSCCEAC